MTVLQAASHADAAAALASSGVLRQLVQGLEASQRGAGAAGDQVCLGSIARFVGWLLLVGMRGTAYGALSMRAASSVYPQGDDV